MKFVYQGFLMARFSKDEISRIIEMAWEDRTPFEALKSQFGILEKDVIRLMRLNIKQNSFKLWRKRVNGRKTKHLKLRSKKISRAYCSRQYKT